jgi:hypothetical protein
MAGIMNTKYKILFAVDVLNEYYAGAKCNDFGMVPSPPTLELMKQRQLLYRVVGNKLLVLTKVDDDGRPFVPLDASDKLVFYQQLNKPLFMQVTNVDEGLLATRRFYFTNLHQNSQESVLYLTSPIQAYANANAYATGGFAAAADGTVFEALQRKAAGDSHPTTDAAFWAGKGKLQYASSQDMLPLVRMSHRYAVAAAIDFVVNIYTLDTAANTYTQLVKTDRVTFEEAATVLQVNLSGLLPGKYRIDINGQEFLVYADDNCAPGNCFAVLELFNHLPAASAFALLDADGKVKDTVVAGKPVWLNYVVRYANRRAFWRYITRAAKPPGAPTIDTIVPADVASTVVFDPGPPGQKDYFLSQTKLPLTEAATKDNEFTISFTDVGYGTVPAPRPNLTLSGILEKPPAEDNFYCNIFLNY